MRYIGLDLGSKTLGVAISDVTNVIASGYTVIRFSSCDYEEALLKLDSIIYDNGITHIVLGFPKNMDNTLGMRANVTLEFKDMLSNRYNLPVILVDERLTSVISNNVLIDADMSRKKRKKVVDVLAATIILQSYLDKWRNENNE